MVTEDELAIGHLGRLAHWCGANSREEIAEILRHRMGRSYDKLPLLHVMAAQCGLNAHTYAATCSMLPFTCFGVDECHTLGRTESTWSPKVMHAIGLLTPSKALKFCPECALRQESQNGYSVWRRCDQLPGNFNCTQHAMPMVLADTKSAFAKSPSALMEAGQYQTIDTPADCLRHARIDQFIETTGAMLRTGRSWPMAQIRERLSTRAKSRGLRSSMAESGSLLSDLAFDSIPTSYLQRLFPLAENKHSDRVFSSIDAAVFRSGNSPSAVAIALAMTL